MKFKGASRFLSVCVVIALAAHFAYARSMTAFSAFHVEGPTGSDPYACLNENNGAVVNNCTYDVSLEFDLPIDSSGTKSITVQDYWAGSNAQNTFYCISYAYTGTQGSSVMGTVINFTAPSQSFVSNVSVAPNSSMQLICWNVPPGGGVSNLNWTK